MLKTIRRLYNGYLSPHRAFAGQIKRVIGRYPVNLELYRLAFTHKSAATNVTIESNERLEYLGDALLTTYVAAFLYRKYPTENEGFLTKMRSKIVQRKTLNHIADSIELEPLLASLNKTKISDSMMGNALEALIGAIYLENGYKYTQYYVIKKLLRQHIDVHELENVNENFKSILLEWCQKHGKELSFGLVSKYRQNKRDKFKVSVLVDNETIAVADDYNKKSAEQKASQIAIVKLGVA